MWNGSLRWALVGGLKQHTVIEFLTTRGVSPIEIHCWWCWLFGCEHCASLVQNMLRMVNWGKADLCDTQRSDDLWSFMSWNFPQLLSCYESEDEEFVLWQPVKHGCITLKLKPSQSMKYHQKGSSAPPQKKIKTPRLRQEKSWLQYFCDADGVIPMAPLKPETTIKSEHYTA